MKRFEKFAHHQFKALIRHLKKYRDAKKPETLHKIRIDIKKIKAILGVIDDNEKQFKAHKKFTPFRNIFRKAAEIRASNVNEHLLMSHEMDKGDATPGHANVKKLIRSYVSSIPSFITTTKRNRNKLKTEVTHVKRNDLVRYLHKKQKEIKSQLFPRPKMRHIHKTRKDVKEVMYLSEANGKVSNKEINFYDKMQEKIGELHDKQMLLQLLKKKSDQTGKTQFEGIKAECLADKKEIIHLATTFYRLNAESKR